MQRKPVYHQNSTNLRVVSKANGVWQVQERVDDHGTREQDHWEDIPSAPMIQAEAVQRMYSILPVKS